MKRTQVALLSLTLLAAYTISGCGVRLGTNSGQANPPPLPNSNTPGPAAVPNQPGESRPADPLHDRLLVVYNLNSASSLDVADHYAAMRRIPAAHKLGIAFPSATSLEWAVYVKRVQPAVREAITKIGRDRVLYIVMAYDTPWRMDRAPATMVMPGGSRRGGNLLDSFLADVFDQLDQTAFVNNPYYTPAQSKANVYSPFEPFSDYRAIRGARQIYSVWRLDGATPALAKGLVDRAIRAEVDWPAGRCYFDGRRRVEHTTEDAVYAAGDWDIYRAAEFAEQKGCDVTRDEHEEEFGTWPAPPSCPDALFYAGWYSLDHYNDVFTWVPGSIGIHLDSASAKDIRGGGNWAANALKRGLTVTAGATAEPYLEQMPHPDGVFRDIYMGANVGDAFYRNTSTLRWVIVFVGDPLYRPFRDSRRDVR